MIPFLAPFVAKPLASLGVGAAVLVVGFAAGVGFEHRPTMGFPFSLIGQGLATQRDDWRRRATLAEHDLAGAKANRQGWVDAYGRCEADRAAMARKAGADVEAAAERRAETNSSAFDAGYRAGRVAGRRTCGDPHANPVVPGPAGGPVPGGGPGGVRPQGSDSADVFGHGAYRPGGGVPADDRRGVPR